MVLPKACWHVLLVVLLTSTPAFCQRAGEEITYPNKDFSRLETFEGLNLEDADKLYGKRDYTGAYAAYKAYSFEFAKSPASCRRRKYSSRPDDHRDW